MAAALTIGRAAGLTIGRAAGLTIGRAAGLTHSRAVGLTAGCQDSALSSPDSMARAGSCQIAMAVFMRRKPSLR